MGREGKRAPKRREGERLSRYRRFCRYQFFPLSRSPSFISRRPMSRMIWAPFCGGRQLLLILLQTADVTKCGYTASRKRLRNFGSRFGEFCVCKFNASAYAGQIGAIHTLILTKPVTSSSKLIDKGDECRAKRGMSRAEKCLRSISVGPGPPNSFEPCMHFHSSFQLSALWKSEWERRKIPTIHPSTNPTIQHESIVVPKIEHKNPIAR